MTRKKGYLVLLSLTVFFTLCGIVMAILYSTGNGFFSDKSPHLALIYTLLPALLAGCTCIARKRLFTEE